MLMYPRGMKESVRLKRELLQARQKERERQQAASSSAAFGVQSELVLRTHQQDEEHLKQVDKAFQEGIQRQKLLDEARRHRRWLSLASGHTRKEVKKKERPKTAA